MFRLPRHSPHTHDRLDLEQLLRQCPPPYQPLRPDPRLDIAQPPREGELAWLLAYGLPDEYRLEGARVWLETADGPIHDDPGLAQAWAHARGHRVGGAADEPSPQCFSPPPSPPRGTGPLARRTARPPRLVQWPAGDLTPLEQLMTHLTKVVVTTFMRYVAIQRPGPDARPEDVEALQRKAAALAHIFDIPLGKSMGDTCRYKADEAATRPADEVFGFTEPYLLKGLELIGTATVENVRQGGAGPLPAESFMLGLAACEQYVQQCLARIEAMGKQCVAASPAKNQASSNDFLRSRKLRPCLTFES